MPRYPSSDYTASTDDRQGFFGAPDPSRRSVRTDERQGYFGAPDPTSAASSYYPPHQQQQQNAYTHTQQPSYHSQQAAPRDSRPMSQSQRPAEPYGGRRIEDEESGWDLPEESDSSVLRCLCFRQGPPLPHPRTAHLRSTATLHVNEAALEGVYSNDHYYDPPGDALAGFCSLCRCLFCPAWCAVRDTMEYVACIGCEIGSAVWESLPRLTLWTSYQARRNNGRITPYIPPPLSEPSTPSYASLQLKNGDGISSPFQVSPRYELNYQREGFVTKEIGQLSPPPKAAHPPFRVSSPWGRRRPRPPKTPYPAAVAVEFADEREKW
ncbi:hypothetical protein BCV69DRAFT_313422 [Microstroma glucosiphilum]|uniref:Uncharacterized protein n=1 Tax=Pseudomicrostroma glucosiphilum TaxID=1684307 RepID=A0A316U3B3_9BASI|nr:hypothetical protein BCV69DRAFT_313422 [Pseudomicrostroma glucosiphilum]PWN19670.1 hypothetical protein BCV69DRAFT_313422 [Pseudomicrostroma glucosiphilum]